MGELKHLYLIAAILISIIQPAHADSQVMTWYSPATSGGDILRSGYRYDEIKTPFGAVDAAQYDRLAHHRIFGTGDGVRFSFVVLDSGYLARHCVEQPGGECWTIALDIGREWFVWGGLSVPVSFEVGMDSWWGKL